MTDTLQRIIAHRSEELGLRVANIFRHGRQEGPVKYAIQERLIKSDLLDGKYTVLLTLSAVLIQEGGDDRADVALVEGG